MNSPDNMSPFIPSRLDDLGLSAAEFRVVCRIARRGKCTEGIPSMAKSCRLHPDTVWAALKRLEALRLVSRESRVGSTSLFRLRPTVEWLTPSPEDKGHPKEMGTPPIPVGEAEIEGWGAPEIEGHKGNPIKVIKKGTNSPEAFRKPSIEEVRVHFKDLHAEPEADKFYDYQESKGWVVGRAPMKNWEAAARNWVRNDKKWSKSTPLLGSGEEWKRSL